MSVGLIEGQTLSAIAQAIRAQTGSSDAMTPAQMAQAIGSMELSNIQRTTGVGNIAFEPAQTGSLLGEYVLSAVCGFRPDLVILTLPGFTAPDTGTTQDYLAAFPFREWENNPDRGDSFIVMTMNNTPGATYPYLRMCGQTTETGFRVTLRQFSQSVADFSGNFGFTSLPYAAIKYES